MRLFLDANILFSAAHRESGSMRLFFVLADAGWCELLSSPYAIEEARRNIVRRYAGRAADLEALAAKLRPCGEPNQEMLAWAATQGLPPKDVPILAAAAQARVDILVTGDRTDFGHLYRRNLRGLRVLPPVATFEMIIGASR